MKPLGRSYISYTNFLVYIIFKGYLLLFPVLSNIRTSEPIQTAKKAKMQSSDIKVSMRFLYSSSLRT